MKKLLLVFLAFAFMITLAVPAFASETPADYSVGTYAYSSDTYSYHGITLPLFSEYEDLKAEYPYIMLIESPDGYSLYLSPEQPFALSTASSYGLYCKFTCSFLIYSLTGDPVSWKFTYSRQFSSGSAFILSSNSKYCRWSNCDIYDSNGTLCYEGDLNFPPAPLPEIILEAVEERMAVEIPALIQTMMILAVSGVGCLAFLTGFYLLRNRFPIFLR